MALEHGIPVFQPEKIKDEEACARLLQEQADVFVVVAYGQLLSERLLTMPAFGCVNVHASLLPKYRGASPIQWAIAQGEEKSGVTIMQMDAGMDTGDILLQEEVALSPEETGESLFEKLSLLGGDLLLQALTKMEEGSLKPVAQEEENASYAPLLRKEMGEIDWTEEASAIRRKVYAFHPWPGTYTTYRDKLLKIVKAEAVESDDRQEETPGTVLAASEKGIDVLCGKGILRITQIQLSGKKRMDTAAFLRGFTIEPLTKMGE